MSYLKFDNNGKVNVTAKLWKVRSDIRISAGYTGEPAEGYVVDSVTTVPETFSVAGSEEALNNLKLQGNTIYLDPVRTSGSQSISCRRAVRYTASRQRISK